MKQRKNKPQQGKFAKRVVLSLVALVVLIGLLTLGQDVALYNPKGLIATQQFQLMMFSSGLMLLIAIPAMILLYFTAWKYRETNHQAVHNPQGRLGKLQAASLWVIPIIALVILSAVVWPVTHKLDPHKPIKSTKEPLTVQVIALQWKWLFIYPEQGIATVNYVQVPVDRPLQFDLTADEAPMNSFWIPHLGGQLYAMTGHSNQLNLIANTVGEYPGQAAEINGEGFAGMRFTAKVSSAQDFNNWVREVRQSSNYLNNAEYSQLLKHSQNNPPMLYASVEPNLYSTVLKKYSGSNGHEGH